MLQTEGEENMHVETSNEHGTEQTAKEDLNVENTNEHGTEQPAKEDLNVDTSSVLPGSDADKGEYLPNEHGTEQPAKEDLDVENNSVLPTTSGDNGQSSPKGDGTQSHVTEDINVENNSVLPQAEGHQGETTPNEVDIQLRDKGDSTPNGNDIQVPDEGDSNQNRHKADLNTQEISKEENLLQILKKWNLPLMNVALIDLDVEIKAQLAKEGRIIKPRPTENIDICKAKPVGSLKEEDPLMDCLRTEQLDEVANLIKDDAKPAKQGTSKVNEEKHKTENGEIEIKQYAIKCGKRQNKKLPCSACDQVFGLVKDFNIHMKEKHPDVKFRCQHCPKVYDTYNAHYKQEYKHFQLPYKCHHCDKRFLFPGLRAKHEKQHTGVGLLPCTWLGCKSKLSCPDALRQHIVTHTDQHFPCSKCDKDFNTETNLQQHMKGKHGDGFIALCGAVYDWSDQ